MSSTPPLIRVSPTPKISLFSRSGLLRRLLRNRSGAVGLAIIIIYLVIGLLGALRLTPYPPAQNHANIFTHTLADAGITTAPITSKEYAQDPTLLDSSFTLPLFQLDDTGQQLVPGLATVAPRLANVHPVAVARWFTLPHPDLVDDDGNPVSPRAWLLGGGDPVEVAALADELHERG